MTDVFDRATEIEEATRDDAIERQHRRAGLAGKTADDSSLVCRECDATIPEARRHALPGVQTCVDCQTLIEARS